MPLLPKPGAAYGREIVAGLIWINLAVHPRSSSDNALIAEP